MDYCFTIPNFPSRLLSYLEKGIPVLSCTDPNTDIGDIIENNGFGWKCLSNDSDYFCDIVNDIVNISTNDLRIMGNKSRKFLEKEYLSSTNYKKLISEMK